MTPLYVACENSHTEIAQLLIDKGADVNRRNKVYAATSLVVQFVKCYQFVAKINLSQFANVNMTHRKMSQYSCIL